MHYRILLILLLGFVFSCHDEVEDNHLDWIEQMDNTICSYEKTAKIEVSKCLVKDKIEYVFDIYEKDTNGLQKLIGHYIDEAVSVNVIGAYYVINNEVVFESLDGLFPLIYKTEKKETDPCCELFNRSIYYKSKSEGNVFMKRIKILNARDKEKFIQELNLLPFEEQNSFNIESQYSKTIKLLEEIIED